MKAYEIGKYSALSNNGTMQIKFGGQPEWLSNPQWPVSKAWGNRPMKFMCQIRLDQVLDCFQGITMAYIFLTQPYNKNDYFYDPDVVFPFAGENAVIIQPRGIVPNCIALSDMMTGPSVDMEKIWVPSLIEKEETYMSNFKDIDIDKIGGFPAFFQNGHYEQPDDRLLLQLHTNWLPFYINVGASPTMYVIINRSGDSGYILIEDM